MFFGKFLLSSKISLKFDDSFDANLDDSNEEREKC